LAAVFKTNRAEGIDGGGDFDSLEILRILRLNPRQTSQVQFYHVTLAHINMLACQKEGLCQKRCTLDSVEFMGVATV